MGIPLNFICCFSFAAFNICSLCLIFVNLINVSWDVSPWVYPVWDSLGFLDLGGYFLSHFREVFNYYLKFFLMTFLFVFFFWDSYNSNVGAFNIVPEVSEVVLISFNSFLFFPLCSFISTILSSTSLILSASVILLLVPSRVFFYLIYCIIHYILALFNFF